MSQEKIAVYATKMLAIAQISVEPSSNTLRKFGWNYWLQESAR